MKKQEAEEEKNANQVKKQPTLNNDFTNFELTQVSIPNLKAKLQKNLTDFKLCKIPKKIVLGQGAFGKVYLAQQINTK